MKKSLYLVLVIVLLIIGCAKKEVQPVPVGDMTEYKDPAFGFKIKHPSDWRQMGEAGRALFAKSQEVANKFMDPRSGEEGGQVVVEVIKYEGRTFDDIINQKKDELKTAGKLEPDQSMTIGGKPATKVVYDIPVTNKTSIKGYEIYIQGDTAIYGLDFAGYGDQFGAHAAVFDAMLKSFELPVIVAQMPDQWNPSGNLESFPSPFFTMQYPDNMNIDPKQKKKDQDFVMEMHADRLDCSIHIDVFGAQKLTVDKVWEQNKSKYKSKGTGETSIDGNKAFWVDYVNLVKGNSRTYFVVKNDKVIRSTINWFPAQKDIYFPVFEKCITTMKLK